MEAIYQRDSDQDGLTMLKISAGTNLLAQILMVIVVQIWVEVEEVIP